MKTDKQTTKKIDPVEPQGNEAAPAYRITVKRDGFRRCGRAWSGETQVREGELTDDEIQVLKTDPLFMVEAL